MSHERARNSPCLLYPARLRDAKLADLLGEALIVGGNMGRVPNERNQLGEGRRGREVYEAIRALLPRALRILGRGEFCD